MHTFFTLFLINPLLHKSGFLRGGSCAIRTQLPHTEAAAAPGSRIRIRSCGPLMNLLVLRSVAVIAQAGGDRDHAHHRRLHAQGDAARTGPDVPGRGQPGGGGGEGLGCAAAR